MGTAIDIIKGKEERALRRQGMEERGEVKKYEVDDKVREEIRGSSDSESKYDSILSTEWGHIFLDEISEISWQPVSKLLTRLAQKLPVKNKMLYALNPCSKNHWSYKRFFLLEDYDTGVS